MPAAAPAANAGLVSGITNTLLPTCGSSSQPFAQFGDYNSYYAVPNNGLENGPNDVKVGLAAKVS